MGGKFSVDNFHPSQDGYRDWSRALVEALGARRPRRCRRAAQSRPGRPEPLAYWPLLLAPACTTPIVSRFTALDVHPVD